MFESFSDMIFESFFQDHLWILIVPLCILCLPICLKLLIPTLMSVFSTKISGVGSIMPGWISPMQSTADSGAKGLLVPALMCFVLLFAVIKNTDILNIVY